MDEAVKSKGKMTDEERAKLIARLDKDLEEHLAKLEAKAAERGNERIEGAWTEENWEEEMRKHPFFNQGWKEGEELSPLMKGLQDLKYSPDENTPDELAKSYKEDGNFNFKCKKYRFAVASYTEGLKTGSKDTEVNTQLLTNRAAAQFHIGNFRSSLRDCEAAVKLCPAHMKALVRGAQCHHKLGRHAECGQWCDRGLLVDAHNKELLQLRAEAVRLNKERERDERKRALAEKRRKAEEERLLGLIQDRGITVHRADMDRPLSMEHLEPCHPAAMQKKVHVDEKEGGHLVWPVLFMYPEYGETDFVEEFREYEQFMSHFEVMFGDELPPWDQQHKYKPADLVIYFEDCNQKLQEVSRSSTLREALSRKGYVLKGGTPGFIIMVKGSKAEKEFVNKYV